MTVPFDPECICDGNWRKIVAEAVPLIGERFENPFGELWTLEGIVHGGDDYYYLMVREGKLQMLSCVASIEGHHFKHTPIAKANYQEELIAIDRLIPRAAEDTRAVYSRVLEALGLPGPHSVVQGGTIETEHKPG
jgi:hypothetical protein